MFSSTNQNKTASSIYPTKSGSNKVCVVLSFLLLTGCGYRPTLFESSLAGTAVGAGTGALVGSVISRGDIAASAGLGALIGLPVGLALGAYYQSYLEEQEVEEVRIRIKEQQAALYRNDLQLEALRSDLDADHPDDLDLERRDDIYDGATMGNPYR